jgi:hypothetical protein
MNYLERMLLGSSKIASAMPMDWGKATPFMDGVSDDPSGMILHALETVGTNKAVLGTLGALGAGGLLYSAFKNRSDYNKLKENSVSKQEMQAAIDNARIEANRKAALKWGLAGLTAGSVIGGYGGYRLGSRVPAAKKQKPAQAEYYDTDIPDYYQQYYSGY